MSLECLLRYLRVVMGSAASQAPVLMRCLITSDACVNFV